jgi:hypothetical protein
VWEQVSCSAALRPALPLCDPAGTSGGASAGEAAVRAALKDYSERLPAPFSLSDIEGRVKDKTPYVVVALQEVRMGGQGAGASDATS